MFPVVSHYVLFDVYVVYVGDGVQSDVVCGVLTLYELQASPSFVCCVLYQLSFSVSCVSNGSCDVWFVVLWSFVFA